MVVELIPYDNEPMIDR